MAGFLVDENLPASLAAELSSRGLPAQHIFDIPALRGAADDDVIAHAGKEGLVLVTKDKELSLITRSPSALDVGVVAVRLRENLPIDEQVRIVVTAIASLDPREFAGRVVVVEPGRVRIRRKK